MDKFKDLIETSAWFILMGLLTVIKDGMGHEKAWNWKLSAAKFFTNIVAGVGFYSFVLSYKPYYGEYPQKIWVIMLVVYGGNKFIDAIVERIAIMIKKFSFKKFIQKIIELWF